MVTLLIKKKHAEQSKKDGCGCLIERKTKTLSYPHPHCSRSLRYLFPKRKLVQNKYAHVLHQVEYDLG
jgi:hypothetical protein